MKYRQYSKYKRSNHTPGRMQYIFQETHRKSKNGCMLLGKNRSDTRYTIASCL